MGAVDQNERCTSTHEGLRCELHKEHVNAMPIGTWQGVPPKRDIHWHKSGEVRW